MQVPFLDLPAQYRQIQPEVDAAIADVIARSAFVGRKHNTAFEEAFAHYTGVPYCVGCANGTDAIELVLRALGIGPGDEVLVPAHTWISTAEAPANVGARPVFVDSEPGLYTMNPEQLPPLITPRTKAIIPVHLYGMPADLSRIQRIAEEHGLFVVEDAAQAHGARWQGQRVGSFGHAATFSFYPGKNLGAYGDAGCVATADEELARQVALMANHGQPRKNTHECLGRNSRLDGLQSAVLNVKLPYLDQWNAARQEHARRYRTQLADLPSIQLPQERPGAESVYHVFAVEVPDRDRVKSQLEAAGIGTAIHYPTPLPDTPPFAETQAAADEDFPVARAATGRLLSLPMFPEMTTGMIDYVCEELRRAALENN